MSDDRSIKLIKAVKELNIGMNTIVDFLAAKGFKVDKHPMAKLDGEMYTTLLKEFAADKIIKEEAKQITIGKIRKDEPGVVAEKPAETRRSRDFENEEILIKGATTYTPPPIEKPKAEPVKAEERNDVSLPGVKVVGKIDLDAPVQPEKKEEPKKEPEVKPEPKVEAPVAKAEPVKEKPEAPKPVVNEQPAEDEEVIRAKAQRLSGPNVVGKIQLPVEQPRRNQPVASSSNTAGGAADHKRN